MLLGLAGKARTGKDTVARYLVNTYGAETCAFAKPVKDATKVLFGLTDRHLDGDLKETILPEYGFSPRQLMQKVGTDFGRDMIVDDIWIRRMDKAYADSPTFNFIVTDVRFENEADWVRSNGGRLVHLHRDEAVGVARHKSENGIAYHPDDLHIFNNSTLSALKQEVEAKLGFLFLCG